MTLSDCFSVVSGPELFLFSDRFLPAGGLVGGGGGGRCGDRRGLFEGISVELERLSGLVTCRLLEDTSTDLVCFRMGFEISSFLVDSDLVSCFNSSVFITGFDTDFPLLTSDWVFDTGSFLSVTLSAESFLELGGESFLLLLMIMLLLLGIALLLGGVCLRCITLLLLAPFWESLDVEEVLVLGVEDVDLDSVEAGLTVP